VSRKPAPRPRRAAVGAPHTKGALRIVAGSAGGRRIDVPPGSGTRPTSDRVRQAIFNALDSLGAVEGARVFDGFAGSGALGIEALSRGAAHATFVDTDGRATAIVEANLRSLGLEGLATVVTRSAEGVVGSGGAFDLVLLDPPYAYERWDELLADLLPVLSPDAVVVVESDREVGLPPGLRCVRTKTYGGTVVQFATVAGATS
jgi:16S rRNA (guanine966-N2)-methyltransferase